MKRHISIGPGSASLILIIVVLAMSLLATLTFSSARNDYTLSRHGIDITQSNYLLLDRSERSMAELSGLLSRYGVDGLGDHLPNGVTLSGDMLRWQENEGGRVLGCEAQIVMDDGNPFLRWVSHRLLGNLDAGWSD